MFRIRYSATSAISCGQQTVPVMLQDIERIINEEINIYLGVLIQNFKYYLREVKNDAL